MTQTPFSPKLTHAVCAAAWLGFVAYIVILLLRFDADQMEGGVALQTGRVVQIVVYSAFFAIWGASAVFFFNQPKLLFSGFPLVSSVLAALLILNLIWFVALLPFIVRYHLMWLGCLLFAYLYVRQYPHLLPRLAYTVVLVMIPIAALVIMREQAAYAVRDGVVRNEIYWLLPFLPWCFVVNRRTVEVAGVVLAAAITVWTAKRGAAVALGAMLVAMYVTDISIRRGRSDLLFTGLKALGLAALAVGVLFYVDSQRNWILLDRIAGIFIDEGSGRVDLYLATLQSLRQFSGLDVLVGQGYYSSGQALMFTQVNVHNDWLQVIHDFGLIGLGLYVIFQGIVLLRYIDAVRRKDRIAVPLIGMYAYFFCLSVYSVGIFSPRFVMTSIGFGAFIALAEARRGAMACAWQRRQPAVHVGAGRRNTPLPAGVISGRRLAPRFR